MTDEMFQNSGTIVTAVSNVTTDIKVVLNIDNIFIRAIQRSHEHSEC
jgi:hypothetical protein